MKWNIFLQVSREHSPQELWTIKVEILKILFLYNTKNTKILLNELCQ